MTSPVTTARDIPALLTRLRDEADLCRNDGAADVAALLDEAAGSIEDLQLSATASEKDAARYQWLREQMHIAGAAIVEVLQPAGDWGNSVTAESPEGLDAAIDAAMEKANG